MQFGSSCYLTVNLYKGSWNDSQAVCAKIGSHLWTINSHEEWKSVFTKTLQNLASEVGNAVSGIFDPALSPHTFIGLVQEQYQHHYINHVSCFIYYM